MAYHKVLATSEDFINAMKSANKISDAITNMLNNGSNSTQKYEVFPYRLVIFILSNKVIIDNLRIFKKSFLFN